MHAIRGFNDVTVVAVTWVAILSIQCCKVQSLLKKERSSLGSLLSTAKCRGLVSKSLMMLSRKCKPMKKATQTRDCVLVNALKTQKRLLGFIFEEDGYKVIDHRGLIFDWTNRKELKVSVDV